MTLSILNKHYICNNVCYSKHDIKCSLSVSLPREAVLIEVEVQVTDPLDVNGHHPASHGQAPVVPARCCHDVALDGRELKLQRCQHSAAWVYILTNEGVRHYKDYFWGKICQF